VDATSVSTCTTVLLAEYCCPLNECSCTLCQYIPFVIVLGWDVGVPNDIWFTPKNTDDRLPFDCDGMKFERDKE
jgi:hypothetical protein